MIVMDKELISIREAAKRFQQNPETIRLWIRRGKITGYTQPLRKAYLVDPKEIEEGLAIHTIQPQDEIEGDEE